MNSDSLNFRPQDYETEAQGGDASTAPGAISEGAERSGDALNTALSTTCGVQITEVESRSLSEEEMVTLLTGIDSVDIGFYVTFREPTWAEVRTAMTTEKAMASRTEGIRSHFGNYLVLPAGRKGYPWHLQYAGFHLYIQDTSVPNSAAPNVLACVNSEYLWHHSPEELISDLTSTIESFDAEIQKQKVSRIDLSADFIIPGGLKLDQLLLHCVPNDLSSSTHSKGPVLETFYHGATDSPVRIRIYNKSKEIAKKGIKTWFYDLWKIEPREDIWRVEAQIRRTFLKQNKIETLTDFHARRSDIWAYLTERFLTFREFDDENTTRRSIQAWWKVVQEAVKGGDARSITRRNPKTKPEIKKLLATFLGYSTSIAARLQVSDPWALWNDLWNLVEPYLYSQKFRDKYYQKSILLGFDPSAPIEKGADHE